MAVLLPLSSSAQSPFSVDSHTVALWHLDEASGIVFADATGVNNGSAFGQAATAIVPGQFNNARSFRGDGLGDYLQVPDNPSLRNLSAITIEAWVKPGPFPHYRESIVQKGDATFPYNLYLLGLLGNPDGTFKFEFAFMNQSQPSQSVNAISPNSYQPDQWYYVVGSYDGTRGRLYVNGGQVGPETGSAPGLTVTNTAPLFLANNTFLGGSFSNGLLTGIIDEVRVSDVARTGAEIDATYRGASFYDAVSETAQSAFGTLYVLGAKGYDGAGSRKFVPPARLSSGYNIIAGGRWVPGHGLDCSGLTMWSYNRTFYSDQEVNWNTCVAEKKCPIFQEGAHGQYDANTDRISAQDVRVGDLLFFDVCIGDAANCRHGSDGRMDHVALFAGPFVEGGQTYNAVHANFFSGDTAPATFNSTSETLTTVHNGNSKVLTVADYGRVSDPRLDAWIVTKSPVHLVVTDPAGVRVSRENALLNNEGFTREVDGMYYMVKEITEGGADDTVAIPDLKPGAYFISVKPKEGASPLDVFSLEVRLPDRTIVLADQAPIEEIPTGGYGLWFTGSELTVSNPISLDIQPGSETNAINLKSNGATPVAILTTDAFDAATVDPLSIRFGLRHAGESHGRGHLEDVDRDGDTDLVLHFKTTATGIAAGDTEACLSGQTFGGVVVFGCDSVKIVPGK